MVLTVCILICIDIVMYRKNVSCSDDFVKDELVFFPG